MRKPHLTEHNTEMLKHTVNIWRPPSVAHQPVVSLSRWAIFRCEFEDGTESEHAVGFSGESRVTSAIQEHRFDKGEVVTRSGRVYKLLGSPGLSMDSLYLWDTWAGMNNVQKDTNIQEEYYAKILDAEADMD